MNKTIKPFIMLLMDADPHSMRMLSLEEDIEFCYESSKLKPLENSTDLSNEWKDILVRESVKYPSEFSVGLFPANDSRDEKVILGRIPDSMLKLGGNNCRILQVVS